MQTNKYTKSSARTTNPVTIYFVLHFKKRSQRQIINNTSRTKIRGVIGTNRRSPHAIITPYYTACTILFTGRTYVFREQ